MPSNGVRPEKANGKPSSDLASPQGVPPTAGLRPRVLTGKEVFLAAEEIIVSKTDLRGKITYVNDVFLSISGFEESELLGQPHSMIRHPDMPRAVFKLLWDSIASGREIFAYVVNITKDGGHYWVLAHVTPTFDDEGNIIGYHSNRRSPDRVAIELVKPLYARLVALEKKLGRNQEAVSASLAELQKVACENHGSYEEFVLSLEQSKGAAL